MEPWSSADGRAGAWPRELGVERGVPLEPPAAHSNSAAYGARGRDSCIRNQVALLTDSICWGDSVSVAVYQVNRKTNPSLTQCTGGFEQQTSTQGIRMVE